MNTFKRAIVFALAGVLLVLPACSTPEPAPTPSPEPAPAPPIRPRVPIPVSDNPVLDLRCEAPDDLCATPGGITYKSHIHEVDAEGNYVVNSRTQVMIDTKVLRGNEYTPLVTYRGIGGFMNAGAGETKYNILNISTDAIMNEDVRSLKLYTVDLPAGIEVTEISRGQGIPSLPESTFRIMIILAVKVSGDIELDGPARYKAFSFEIGLEINDTDCGTFPCAINVN